MANKRTKKKITYTITDNNGNQLNKMEFIKALLWAVFVYATGVLVLASIVIVILYFVFKFNILIPLLIAVPASLLMGVLILVLTVIYDNMLKRNKKNIVQNNDLERNKSNEPFT